MNRDLVQFSKEQHDLLVIGGGIHGACVAWDAALRGLSVALVEMGDFGQATSANSLKTVHGGLRYLQDGDLRVVRRMIHERRSFARIAPHLVHPLPCLMPTLPKLSRSKLAMTAALALNDLMGLDRNRLADPEKHLPRGRIISREECLRLLPGVSDIGITGGALWYDYQIYNTERLTLAFILSAAGLGANVANYVEAIGFLEQADRVTGVRAQDMLTGDEFDVRAKVIVNATGPWANRVLGLLNDERPERPFRLSTAMNLVTRQVIPEYAAGLSSKYSVQSGDGATKEKSQLLFVAPWRGCSIIGTHHAPYNGLPGDYSVTEEQIHAFLDQFDSAYPGAGLKREDVFLVHGGLLPAEQDGDPGDVKLVRHGRVYDHGQDGGPEGLLTLLGVKYTTARHMARKAVDRTFVKLGKDSPKCLTDDTLLWGGQIGRFDDFLIEASKDWPQALTPQAIQHLVHNYGSEYGQILSYLKDDASLAERVCSASQVLKAEVVHAMRNEMAQRLTDIVLRRTELGTAGYPGELCLRSCAALMAEELNWDDKRVEEELSAASAAFTPVI